MIHFVFQKMPNKWFQYILDHPEKKWDYYWLSMNPNITWEIVQENPRKPWEYYWISTNPNITWKIVQENPRKPWKYSYLSANHMYKFEFPLCIMKQRARERMSKIKEELIAKAWHPDRVQRWLDAGMDVEEDM